MAPIAQAAAGDRPLHAARPAAAGKPPAKPDAKLQPKPRSRRGKPGKPRRAASRQPAAPSRRAEPSRRCARPTRRSPLAERIAIQSDLAWTGDYNGLINGEFSDTTDRRGQGVPEAAASTRRPACSTRRSAPRSPPPPRRSRTQVGWRMVEDRGHRRAARHCRPSRSPNKTRTGKTGTRWSSAQGQVQVETFRIREPGTTLDARVRAAEEGAADAQARATTCCGRTSSSLSGMQGLKKFYVRADVKDGEVRGITILYDQATEGIMDPVVVAMSSAFAPFPACRRRADRPPPQAQGRVRHRHRRQRGRPYPHRPPG